MEEKLVPMFAGEGPILEGDFIRLEPLQIKHAPHLYKAQDIDIWKYMPFEGPYNTEEQFLNDYILSVLESRNKKLIVPFVVVDKNSNIPIGLLKMMDIQPNHKGLELGGIWYAKSHQKSAANAESNYLLLKYSFEVLGCIRVFWKVDSRNEKSLAAWPKLGAKQEGIIRYHYITKDGYYRDSVYFSIIDKEWPTVKPTLENRIYKRTK